DHFLQIFFVILFPSVLKYSLGWYQIHCFLFLLLLLLKKYLVIYQI
ncbi:GSCOCG00003806001-RA-CDS, partial [Cotesia congregata]